MADTTTSRQSKTVMMVDAEDINWIKDSLTNLKDKVDTIDKTTVKLNTTIVGDPQYGQVGLVSKVKEIDDYIEKDKSFKSKIIGASIVFGGVWTLVIKFWDKIF
jgi:hypothetical protein